MSSTSAAVLNSQSAGTQPEPLAVQRSSIHVVMVGPTLDAGGQEVQAHDYDPCWASCLNGLIECVGSQLKHLRQIEHVRHRSVANAHVNILAALVAYMFRPHKPSLDLTTEQTHQIATIAF